MIMSTELVPFENKRPVVMKGGLVHWVGEDTAQRIQGALQAQRAHSFMKITELDITINTAEIEGVYTMEQYEDIAKVKQGMWQCEFRIWHKRREECECRVEAKSKMRTFRNLERRLKEEDLKGEEKISVQRYFDETSAWLTKRGLITT